MNAREPDWDCRFPISRLVGKPMTRFVKTKTPLPFGVPGIEFAGISVTDESLPDSLNLLRENRAICEDTLARILRARVRKNAFGERFEMRWNRDVRSAESVHRFMLGLSIMSHLDTVTSVDGPTTFYGPIIPHQLQEPFMRDSSYLSNEKTGQSVGVNIAVPWAIRGLSYGLHLIAEAAQ